MITTRAHFYDKKARKGKWKDEKMEGHDIATASGDQQQGVVARKDTLMNTLTPAMDTWRLSDPNTG